MKKQHLGLLVALGAVIGAGFTFLGLHKPTREKVAHHTKKAKKQALKTIKEQASKIKVD